MLQPGPGVGGHCIPKDPWLLAAALGEGAPNSLMAAGRRLNDAMPAHVARLVRLRVDAQTPRVALLGYAYLENSDDARNSPSAALVRLLEQDGCVVVVHDPFIEGYRSEPIECLRGADCAVLMVAHTAYASLDLRLAAGAMRRPLLVDTRGFLDRSATLEAGFELCVLGVG